MKELSLEQVQEVNGGKGTAKAIKSAAMKVARFFPHPAVKVAALIAAGAASAYIGYTNNRV